MVQDSNPSPQLQIALFDRARNTSLICPKFAIWECWDKSKDNKVEPDRPDPAIYMTLGAVDIFRPC